MSDKGSLPERAAQGAERGPSPERERTWRFPWEPVPDDDGYAWSLRMARFVCGCLLGFPVLFTLFALPIIVFTGHPHEEPVITAVLAVLAVTVVPAAPFVRERIARVGIGAHLAGDKATRRPRSVYAGFATATITGFMVGQAGALFGFVDTALTRTWGPLIVGSALSYAVWWFLWPRRLLWDRWTWQARLRRDDT